MNGNRWHGILVENSPNTVIGEEDAPNVLVGSETGSGIFLTGAQTTDVTIQHNFIGVGPDGLTPMPNNAGISSTNNNIQDRVTIGGPGAGPLGR